jgi:hypothetical protein
VLPLVIAIAYGILLVIGSPFVGVLRAALRAEFPTQFSLVVGGTIAGIIAVAFLVAIARARHHRAMRFGLLLAALAVGSGFAWLLQSGFADVDVVERFHFIEYGLLTLLFYRAWRGRGDASVFVLPLLASLLVGIADEGVQWFIPSRVGEARDVLLDGAASLCGLLFALGLMPPAVVTASLGRSRRIVGTLAAVTVVAFALFLQAAHIGYEIGTPETGAFRSTYSHDELLASARDREQRWRAEPPLARRLLSREDQYLSEAIWHVQRRNAAWRTGDIRVAWEENRILETYFAPVLDSPTLYSATGFRWPPAQAQDADTRRGREHLPYVSDAGPYQVYTWPRSIFWGVILAVSAAFLLWARGGPDVRIV